VPSPRNRAFSKPNPEGWLPKVGEYVWVRGWLVAMGTVRAVYPEIPAVRVERHYGCRSLGTWLWDLDQIRIMNRKEWAQQATKIERDFRER